MKIKCSDVYDFLEETKVGKRVEYIRGLLSNFDNVEEDNFAIVGNRFTNFYIPAVTPSNKFIVAHYDVIDPNFCANDNSASIINMLVYRQNNPNINIALLDGEEPPYMGAGSGRLSELINDNKFGKIENVFNLELTGVGRNALIGSFDTKTNVIMYERCNAKRTFFPFSDSDIFVNNGIDSEVIILVPSKEDGSLKTEIISYCHGSKDNADLLNISDMEYFVDVTMPKMLKDSE